MYKTYINRVMIKDRKKESAFLIKSLSIKKLLITWLFWLKQKKRTRKKECKLLSNKQKPGKKEVKPGKKEEN